jgi:hypothetical protein
MTATNTNLKSPPEMTNNKEQLDRKLFDNYGPVDVKETIGTFFLGVLAILLFLALQRSWNRYESLIEQTRLPNQP